MKSIDTTALLTMEEAIILNSHIETAIEVGKLDGYIESSFHDAYFERYSNEAIEAAAGDDVAMVKSLLGEALKHYMNKLNLGAIIWEITEMLEDEEDDDDENLVHELLKEKKLLKELDHLKCDTYVVE